MKKFGLSHNFGRGLYCYQCYGCRKTEENICVRYMSTGDENSSRKEGKQNKRNPFSSCVMTVSEKEIIIKRYLDVVLEVTNEILVTSNRREFGGEPILHLKLRIKRWTNQFVSE